jgi:hypothetical protein
MKKALKEAYSEDSSKFTDISVDPAILEYKRQFKIRQKEPLNQMIISLNDEEEEEEESSGDDLASSPSRSVISLDSIAENADFVLLE